MTNFPSDFMFTSERLHYSPALFQVSYARAHLAKSSKFASKRTLDYFRKKYPEYANNWLVSQIAVRAETVNVTARLVGCNIQLSYSGYNITKTLTKSCCDVITYH